MNWSEYGSCRCGASAGSPCIHGRHGTPMKRAHTGRPLRSRATVSAAAKTAAPRPAETPETPAEPESITGPGWYLWVQLIDVHGDVVYEDRHVQVSPDNFPRVIRHEGGTFVFDDTLQAYRETRELVV